MIDIDFNFFSEVKDAKEIEVYNFKKKMAKK